MYNLVLLLFQVSAGKISTPAFPGTQDYGGPDYFGGNGRLDVVAQ